MPLVFDSDKEKVWLEGKVPLYIIKRLHEFPNDKRVVKNGILYFQPTRAMIEWVDTAFPDVVWKGYAASQLAKFKILREMEAGARSQRVGDVAYVDIPYKIKPYAHQNKALFLARGKTAFGYFMEQGTGKSKVLLDDAADLFLNGGSNGKIDTLINIAPNGVHRQWVNQQIPTHLSEAVPYKAAYSTPDPDLSEKIDMRDTLKFRNGLRIFSLHNDSLSHLKGKEFLRQLLLSGKCLLSLDESSRFKSVDSKRTQSVIELGRLAKYRRILTGTPVSQGPEDLYSQLLFLDEDILGYSSFYAFKNHFCQMGGFKNKAIVGYINQEELIQKIDSHTFRVLKDDCLDLPERNFITVEVPIHPEQRKIYEQVRKNFFLALESGEIMTAKLAMNRITRLQQITNGFIWQNEKKDKNTGIVVEPFLYEEFPQNRVEACLNIIRNTAKDTKVIIWIKFQGDFKILCAALEKEGIGYVDYVGSTPTEKREPNIKKFENDPSVKVFLSTPKSGGIGLNLTAASEVIWFSRDFSLENELQANDRVHRIGQHRVVNYHFLVSPKTVDEKIAARLAKKLDVAFNLIDLRDFFS